jgi:membrane protease YdiL (CAAX protease family)
LWRTALGAALVLAIYAASLAAVLLLAVGLAGRGRAYEFTSHLVAADTPAATLALLATFAGMAAGPFVAVRLLHRRRGATLFGRAPVVLRDFTVAVAVLGVFYALTVGVWSIPFDAEPGLPPRTWLALLPLTLLGILLQTGAEELVFRGYLTQQLAARFRSRLVWMLIPSLLFGLVHYAPATSGSNVLIPVLGATLFGLYAADLTAVTGSLGAAWGFHFANNVLALAVLATDGTITGLALLVTPYTVDGEGVARLALLADFAILTLAWLLCRVALRR